MAVSIKQIHPQVHPDLPDDPFGNLADHKNQMPDTEDMDDDSDDELDQTPQDVIDLLGFDPRENEPLKENEK